MNKIAYCATWANGVCVESAKSALFEESSLESLKRLIRRVENVIIGYNAYRLLLEKKFNFLNTKVVVLSKENAGTLGRDVSSASTPQDALNLFATSTSGNVLLAGGMSTLNAFIAAGLIDELILDIEPVLSGGTSGLFPALSKRIQLELIGMRKIGAATMQMHYRILN